MRMIKDSLDGDIILVEAVDQRVDRDALRAAIQVQRLRIVSLDLPTSHAAMSIDQQDEFTGRMLDAVNGMMLDVMAAIARKDYEQRRERQK